MTNVLDNQKAYHKPYTFFSPLGVYFFEIKQFPGGGLWEIQNWPLTSSPTIH